MRLWIGEGVVPFDLSNPSILSFRRSGIEVSFAKSNPTNCCEVLSERQGGYLSGNHVSHDSQHFFVFCVCMLLIHMSHNFSFMRMLIKFEGQNAVTVTDFF